jgi:hypothetical protein
MGAPYLDFEMWAFVRSTNRLPFPRATLSNEINQVNRPMAGTLSLSSTVQVFPCPNCRETINTSVQQCPFCSALIDRAAAEQSAAATSRISQACSDASYLKIMLGILIPFGILIFFPFLGLAGIVGFVFIKYAVPIMTIRWWIRYGRIKTTDPDFRSARGTVIMVSAISFLILLFLRVTLFGLRL